MKLELSCNCALEPWEYEALRDYFQIVLNQIEHGRSEYGMDYIKRSDASFLDQIEQELADLSGWSAMRFIKLRQSIATGDNNEK